MVIINNSPGPKFAAVFKAVPMNPGNRVAGKEVPKDQSVSITVDAGVPYYWVSMTDESMEHRLTALTGGVHTNSTVTLTDEYRIVVT